MLDLWSEVQWWEEWQLRIFVWAASSCSSSSSSVPSRVMFAPSSRFMWLAYLGSDAVAIYALTTLFNRHKVPSGSSTAHLEVLWAPVLLHHLGGLHTFSAYSVEDNELWKRHLVTPVSQVTVAIYVFRKSWSGGDKRLLIAATSQVHPEDFGSQGCKLQQHDLFGRISATSAIKKTY
jgi:hypothetical protein